MCGAYVEVEVGLAIGKIGVQHSLQQTVVITVVHLCMYHTQSTHREEKPRDTTHDQQQHKPAGRRTFTPEVDFLQTVHILTTSAVQVLRYFLVTCLLAHVEKLDVFL
jgi:hypothetical protein